MEKRGLRGWDGLVQSFGHVRLCYLWMTSVGGFLLTWSFERCDVSKTGRPFDIQ